MFNSYKEYIEKSSIDKNVNSYENLTNFKYDIDGKNLGITLPKEYKKTIEEIKLRALNNLNKKNYTIAKGNLALKINDMLNCSFVKNLGEHLASEMSKKLYNTEVIVDHVHTYKNIAGSKNIKSSWLWHYDNCSPGQLKILIYLTDVDEGCGCFEIMTNKYNDSHLFESTKLSPTVYTDPKVKTRLSESFINNLKKIKYSPKKVKGRAGTFIVFNQNIPHKANVPTLKPERICIIYNFRPYYKKVSSRINKSITSDWNNPPKTGVKFYPYEVDII
jgi:hypothetical protein